MQNSTALAFKRIDNVIPFPVKRKIERYTGLQDYLVDGCDNGVVIALVTEGDSGDELNAGDCITYECGVRPEPGNYVLDHSHTVSIYQGEGDVLGVIRHIIKKVA